MYYMFQGGCLGLLECSALFSIHGQSNRYSKSTASLEYCLQVKLDTPTHTFSFHTYIRKPDPAITVILCGQTNED